jgi:hypothetical protein
MPYIVGDYLHEPLYVITTITNPIRYKTRWKHYERFAAHVKASGGVLVTVEAAFGERHHALAPGETQHGTPIYGVAPTKPTEFHKARTTEPHQYVQVRTHSELWLKENLLNLGISRLPSDWQYVAWVDADVSFARPNWVGETIHQLQHYKLVQMFSEAQDVGPRYASIGNAQGFVSCYLHGVERPVGPDGGYYGYYPPGLPQGPILWHPGYAWAARREAIDALGGLVDFAIMGAADNHMAHALIGDVETSIHPGMHPIYRDRLLEWQYRAETHIRRNIGYVSGLLIHYWHGRKVDRRYWNRWRVMVDNQFNPAADLKYDWQGVLQLVDRGDARSMSLRDDSMRYFRARQEDSIDLTGVGDDA